MKNVFRNTVYFIFIAIIFSTTFCKKDKPAIPIISTTDVTSITAATAAAGGIISGDGGANVISRGVCWSTSASPTLADNKSTDGTGIGTFSSNLVNLSGGTTYSVRAYATNSAGTGYGSALSFTTLGQSPTPTVKAASDITTTSATINGIVNANYLATTVTFEYGLTISYGSSVTATQSPLTGNTNTNVSAGITGLTAGTTYHYRIKSVNSLGITNSDDITFTTSGQAPSVTTLSATNVYLTGATLNGTINANYFSSVVNFEYGTSTSYGSIITAKQSPAEGNEISNINASITDLSTGTTYHYRIKGVNSLGTSYGNDVIFTTPAAGTATVTDIEGNIYNTITIGTQVWMVENLKTSKYNNGDLIGTTSPANLDLTYATSPEYQWAYEGNESNVAINGRLYTWYAISDSRGVCPTGWHIPTDAEWTTLTNALGDETIAGAKLKETGFIHWRTPNTGATNATGFTALPGGFRDNDGTFFYLGIHGRWWSNTEDQSIYVWYRSMTYISINVFREHSYKRGGLSVRCLKDN